VGKQTLQTFFSKHNFGLTGILEISLFITELKLQINKTMSTKAHFNRRTIVEVKKSLFIPFDFGDMLFINLDKQTTPKAFEIRHNNGIAPWMD
jgi:hypothetical protein